MRYRSNELTRIVCVKCGRLLKVATNGVWAQENVAERGRAYRVSMFDMWQCPECGYEVLAGSGKPVYPDQKESFEKYQQAVEVVFW